MSIKLEKIVIGLSIPFFLIGAIGHGVPLLYPYMLILTPFILLFFGILCAYTLTAEQGWKFLIWLSAVFLTSFFLEVLGVSTGLIFGNYNYGSVLGMHVLGVPPIIGFNWVFVIAGFSRLVRRSPFVNTAVPAALAAALLCVFFDIILEPLAVQLNYWSWDPVRFHVQGIPLQNYAAWFVIAFFSSLFLYRLPKPGSSRFCEFYVGIQTVFFILTRIILALFSNQ